MRGCIRPTYAVAIGAEERPLKPEAAVGRAPSGWLRLDPGENHHGPGEYDSGEDSSVRRHVQKDVDSG